MRLCIVHINAESVSGPYTDIVTKTFDRIKLPETTLEHRYVRSKRAMDALLAVQFLLNKFDCVQHYIAADRAGYDGIMVACTGDPGIFEGRSLVSIPLVGPFEAALHTASAYGQKIGIVTVMERSWIEAVHTLVDSFGLKSKVSGVRGIKSNSFEAFSKGFVDPAPIAAEIEAEARVLVEQGANSIVIASAGLGTIATAAGLTSLEDLGVPIFDSLVVGFKNLEMRVQLTKLAGYPETSRVGIGQSVREKDINRLADLYNFTDGLK